LNQFSYDNLRLSGIQLDPGCSARRTSSIDRRRPPDRLRPDRTEGAPPAGSVVLPLAIDQQALQRFERRLDSIVNPGTPDSINLGRISLSDVVGDIDFQFVFLRATASPRTSAPA